MAADRMTASLPNRFFNFGPVFLGITGKVKQMKALMNALLLMVGLAVFSIPATFAATLKFEPKTTTTMREALVELTKERVTLSLESGEQIEGIVTMVGNSVVYITKLTGKVYYDAVISIDKINAITLRKQF